MPKTVSIAKVGEIKPGQMKAVDVDDKRIAVANVGGAYYAFDAVCTHAGGPLEEGELEGDVVTCPWHGGQFNVRTGKMASPPPMEDLGSYTTNVVGQEVQIELP